MAYTGQENAPGSTGVDLLSEALGESGLNLEEHFDFFENAPATTLSSFDGLDYLSVLDNLTSSFASASPTPLQNSSVVQNVPLGQNLVESQDLFSRVHPISTIPQTLQLQSSVSVSRPSLALSSEVPSAATRVLQQLLSQQNPLEASSQRPALSGSSPLMIDLASTSSHVRNNQLSWGSSSSRSTSLVPQTIVSDQKKELSKKDVSRLWSNDVIMVNSKSEEQMAGNTSVDQEEEEEDEDLGYTDTYSDYMPSKLSIGRRHPDPVVETRRAACSAMEYVLVVVAKGPANGKGVLVATMLGTGSDGAIPAESNAEFTIEDNGAFIASINEAINSEDATVPEGEAGVTVGEAATKEVVVVVVGIIYENYLLGRKRAIWLSVSNDLKHDAHRDLKDIGCHVHVNSLNKIILDECHKAKNLVPTGSSKPTKTGLAVLYLQNSLPKSRVVYCSATGASEPKNMAYMSRLGIWGIGTPFREFNDFIQAVERRGVGAMEIVAMDMKLRGMYMARQLSFAGVGFDIKDVRLSQDFIQMYDAAVKVWVDAREKFEKAADMMDADNKIKKTMWGQFWAAHQRISNAFPRHFNLMINTVIITTIIVTTTTITIIIIITTTTIIIITIIITTTTIIITIITTTTIIITIITTIIITTTTIIITIITTTTIIIITIIITTTTIIITIITTTTIIITIITTIIVTTIIITIITTIIVTTTTIIITIITTIIVTTTTIITIIITIIVTTIIITIITTIIVTTTTIIITIITTIITIIIVTTTTIIITIIITIIVTTTTIIITIIRFFKYLCIASKVQAVVDIAERAMCEGKCVVIGLQSTGEARTLEQLEEAGGELTDFVSTARGVFQTLVDKHFPAPDRKKMAVLLGLVRDTDSNGSRSEVSSPAPTKKRKQNSKLLRVYNLKKKSKPPKKIKTGLERIFDISSDSDSDFNDVSNDENKATNDSLDSLNSDTNEQSSGIESEEEEEDDFNPFGGFGSDQEDPWLNRKVKKKSKSKSRAESPITSDPAISVLAAAGINVSTPMWNSPLQTTKTFNGLPELLPVRTSSPTVFANNSRSSLLKFQQSMLHSQSAPVLSSLLKPMDGSTTQGSASDQCCAMKKDLLEKIEVLGKMLPPNTLDELIDSLGGPEKVSEMTGRKGRVVSNVDGTVSYESRSRQDVSLEYLNIEEKKRFMSGEKYVAIISEAASSGISLQADRRVQNQRRRVHITLELPWSADKAIQQFGRSHRSNQVSAPEYIFLISELAGERRFASVVAKRLESLGALTHGDRRATQSRDLSRYNFDNKYGRAALETVLKSIIGHVSPMVPLPSSYTGNFFNDIRVSLVGVGLATKDDRCVYSILDKDYTNLSRFLNRILGISVERQNLLFSYFTDTLAAVILQAKRSGRWDEGILDLGSQGEDVTELSVQTFVGDKTIGTATTELHTVSVERGASWEHVFDLSNDQSDSNEGFYVSHQVRNDKRTAIFVICQSIKNKLYGIYRPSTGLQTKQENIQEIKKKYKKVTSVEAKAFWINQYESSFSQCSHAYWKGNCKRSTLGLSCEVGLRRRSFNILSGSVLSVWTKVVLYQVIVSPPLCGPYLPTRTDRQRLLKYYRL
ncbi:hypothetical protein QZH41_013286, partial [Actinostola sp. cb2023]